MGTCGLCGPIGVWTGWVAPAEKALAKGAAAITPAAMDCIGLVLVCIVLPAVLCGFFGWIMRKLGWIHDGDLALAQ
jgi:uncharacterized membrane protein